MNGDIADTRSSKVLDRDFKDKLAGVIPQLRAFARSLCGDRDRADDLVQETMLKAWAARERFEEGTNFRAWTFTILRNHFLSGVRRNRFVGEWNDLVADKILSAPASQDRTVELRDLMRALQQLPDAQREALILVGAGGISYEETAEITGVAIGTVKSRVARARTALEAIFEGGILDVTREQFEDRGDPVVSILAYLEKIQSRHGVVIPSAAAMVGVLAA
ncbi:MAG TPA: sigma-70 family RNA polymerase sigma factor [Sphingobium sp.]|uniref:sigma-70 family RNA polymerase sigma factor n=1 Tax=Sphingobium sp. TaxID=1912891 RepID=UPI002ED3E251